MPNEVTIDVKARDRGATAGLNKMKSGFAGILSGLKGAAVAAGADLAASLTGPAVVALAGLSVEAAGAGAALGAFGLAVKPQADAITDLVTAHDAYDKAVQKSGASSSTAQNALKFYNAQLKGLPPATQDAAKGFFNLRSTFKSWSDSLAGTTMPIFTRGMKVLQGIIPKLSPLVKVAAASLDDFMASIEGGVKGGGLDRFLGSVTRVAADSLPRLLGSVKNVAVGVGNLFLAFAPFTSGSLSGGIEKLTARFANWTRSLRGSPEFANFVRQMQANLPAILQLFGNLLVIVGKVSGALLPFSGLTLKVAEAFASLVAAIPQDVMNWLAPTIAGIVLAVKAWSIAQGLLNVVMAASPLGLIAALIIGIGAALIYAYTHSERFRNIVNNAFAAVKDAVSGLKDKIGPTVEAIAQFFTDTLPAAFDEGVGELLNIVGKVDDAVKQVKDQINGLASGKGIGGGGKKKGGLLDIIAPELSHPGEFIGFFRKAISQAIGIVKGFAKTWKAKLGLDGLGSVKSIAGRAVAAALGFARRGYHAFLHASFPGSSVVTRAVKMAVAYARRTYRALLTASFPGAGVVRRAISTAASYARRAYRAVLTASFPGAGVVRGALSLLSNIPRLITVTIRGVASNLNPFDRLGGVSRLGGVRHMQAGGNTTLVGEEGPELVDLPPGAYVRPEATTRGRMLAAGGGGGQPVVVQLILDGRQIAEATFDHTKGIVRVKGGKGPNSAQKAWGYA